MLRFLLTVCFSVLLLPAASITFNTANSQTCFGSVGCGTNLQSLPNNLFASFNPIITDTFTVTPSTPARVTIGSLSFGCLDPQAPCDLDTAIPSGLNFYVILRQLAPTDNTDFYGGINVSGTFAAPLSFLFFPQTTLQLGNYQWRLDTLNFDQTFLPTESIITLYADVSDTSGIPEPSTYVLCAAGLAALAYCRRR